MHVQRIYVEAPASIANLGPGFDVLALAISSPKDYIEIELKEGGEDEIAFLGRYRLQLKFEDTSIAPVVEKFRELTGRNFRVRVRVFKDIKPASGLGSSGADAAAVAYALNRLLGTGLNEVELVKIAAEGEKAAAGTPHMDNVAASLLGGLVIVHPKRGFVQKIRVPTTLKIALVITGEKESTEAMRKVVPHTIDVNSFVNNASCVALLIKALVEGDAELAGKALMCDEIVEPIRARFYGHYQIVKEVLLSHGAKGVALSGAGPSMFAIFDVSPNPHVIKEALLKSGLKDVEVLVVRPRNIGVREVPHS